MAVYFYRGPYPEGWKEWVNNPKSRPIIDGKGIRAMFKGDRPCIRNERGFWSILGTNHHCAGQNYYRWVELQQTNRDWVSDAVLNRYFDALMPKEEQDFAILPASEKYYQIHSVARRQQSQWAKAIKAIAKGKCYVTGSTLALEAAHIKPFAICDNIEAVTLTNGVCLTASVHLLFDSISSVKEIPKNDPLLRIMDMEKLAELIDRRERVAICH